MVTTGNDLKKIELVSPAGGRLQLTAAINAGADAVYIGYEKFGARAYAENFNFAALREAVNDAHRSGVKIYLTLNTLIKDKELPEVAAFLEEYIDICNDGIIIQDFGVYSLIATLFPGTRVHASTQMNVHNSRTASFLHDAGFARAVLAREMTLSEISKTAGKTPGFELEIFAHGSQCYSYSGNCYFSSFTGTRSGNRGRCSQPCRMKYSFGILNKKIKPGASNGESKESWSSEAFYLSKSDLMALDMIPMIAGSGVCALKIEGRMKSAEYTAIVTSVYRKYIDRYYSDPGNYSVDDYDRYKITQIFSREPDTGYLKECFPEKIISPKKAGNVGNFIGRVESINYANISNKNGKKNSNKPNGENKKLLLLPGRESSLKSISFTVKSRFKINNGDILGIWTNHGNEEIKVSGISIEHDKNGRVSYMLKAGPGISLSSGDRVFKLYDKLIDDEAKSYFEHGIKRKTGIDFTGVQKLKNSSCSVMDKRKQVLKANTSGNIKSHSIKKTKKATLTVEIYSIDYAETLLRTAAGMIDNIVLNDFNGIFKEPDLSGLFRIYKKCRDSNIALIIKTPAIIYDGTMQLIENRLGQLFSTGMNKIMVSNTGVFDILANKSGHELKAEIYLGHSLNIYNHLAISFYNTQLENTGKNSSIRSALLSAELSAGEISDLIRLSCKNEAQDMSFSIYSYGFYPVMQSRFKIDYLKKMAKMDKISGNEYYIKDRKGYRFRVLSDYNENLVYLNSKKTCNFFDLPQLFGAGINDIYIDTTSLEPQAVLPVIESYKKAILSITRGIISEYDKLKQSLEGSHAFSGYTRGHLLRELL